MCTLKRYYSWIFFFLSVSFYYRIYGNLFKLRFGNRIYYACSSILVVIGLFIFFYAKIYLHSCFGLLFAQLLSAFVACSVLDQPLPLPSNSPPGEFPPTLWDDFDYDLGALVAGCPSEAPGEEVTPFVRDESLERSLQSRIATLERAESPFIPQEEKGVFWQAIKKDLMGSPNQGAYNQKIAFENKDVLIRERKHECFILFSAIFPELGDNSGLTPEESLKDFFSRFENTTVAVSGSWTDSDQELKFLENMQKSLRRDGVNSDYVRRLLC